jgi:hypothetical protein
MLPSHAPQSRDILILTRIEPTIFTGVHNVMRIAREEVFGPVLSLMPFDEEERSTPSRTTTPSHSVMAMTACRGDARHDDRMTGFVRD